VERFIPDVIGVLVIAIVVITILEAAILSLLRLFHVVVLSFAFVFCKPGLRASSDGNVLVTMKTLTKSLVGSNEENNQYLLLLCKGDITVTVTTLFYRNVFKKPLHCS